MFELGIVIALLLGWEFVLGEFVGGPLMIVLVAVGFRLFLQRGSSTRRASRRTRGWSARWRDTPRWTCPPAARGPGGSACARRAGFTATADYFVMDWAAIWRDIAVGLLVAGALAAWVPDSWWQSLFLVDHPTAAKVWGPLIGPLVAMISFVCSVGNVPLAAVLWNGGISFGGVIAFIFGDLIIAPILNIYRKYYGWQMAAFLARRLLRDDGRRGAGRRVPLPGARDRADRAQREGRDGERHLELHDYLNIVFLALAAVLVWRYFRRGGGRCYG